MKFSHRETDTDNKYLHGSSCSAQDARKQFLPKTPRSPSVINIQNVERTSCKQGQMIEVYGVPARSKPRHTVTLAFDHDFRYIEFSDRSLPVT